eukprot:357663-Chlamydomonas_euryale.AAC.17
MQQGTALAMNHAHRGSRTSNLAAMSSIRDKYATTAASSRVVALATASLPTSPADAAWPNKERLRHNISTSNLPPGTAHVLLAGTSAMQKEKGFFVDNSADNLCQLAQTFCQQANGKCRHAHSSVFTPGISLPRPTPRKHCQTILVCSGAETHARTANQPALIHASEMLTLDRQPAPRWAAAPEQFLQQTQSAVLHCRRRLDATKIWHSCSVSVHWIQCWCNLIRIRTCEGAQTTCAGMRLRMRLSMHTGMRTGMCMGAVSPTHMPREGRGVD